jgi:hypothetical protein
MKPSQRQLNNRNFTVACLMTLLAILFIPVSEALGDPCRAAQHVQIERLESVADGGQGYRMTYCVALPIEVYWRFKTDFDNDFLISNPHITAHRFIVRQGDVVITENRYAHNTKRLFRWQTAIHRQRYRLDFELQNPKDAGQDFHFGSIQLADQGAMTLVYQEARFKFNGDALWAFYPWRGGMRSFLESFVAWEQQTSLAWYSGQNSAPPATQAQVPLRPIFSRNWRHPDK